MGMIKLDTFDNDKFVIVKYIGEMDKEFIVSFMDFVFEKTDKELLEKALIDFRDVNLAFDTNDLKEISNLRLKYLHNHSLRSVYLVSEAKETAFTTLYANHLPQDLVKIRVCSTMSYAIRQLSLNLSVEEMEERINNLSVTFEKK